MFPPKGAVVTEVHDVFCGPSPNNHKTGRICVCSAWSGKVEGSKVIGGFEEEFEVGHLCHLQIMIWGFLSSAPSECEEPGLEEENSEEKSSDGGGGLP